MKNTTENIVADDDNVPWWDYTIFTVVLSVSVIIGVYYGWFRKNENTSNIDYLYGGRNMKTFPVVMSLIASVICGFSAIGIPAETYRYGATYSITCLSLIPIAALVNYLYLPVFYQLKVTTTSEYLELRFSSKIKLIASLSNVIIALILCSIEITVPMMAVAQITDLNMNIVVPVIFTSCIFYTTIGGYKAIVWADTVQLGILIGSWIIAFSIGYYTLGSSDILKTAIDGGRLDIFDFDLDPTKRDSFLLVFFGQIVWILYGLAVDQQYIQRYVSLPSLKIAKRAVILMTLGLFIIFGACTFGGILIYVKYSKCDPMSVGKVANLDQIVPYYVKEVTTSIKGLTGLFVMGVFCASLSTISSAYNSMAILIYEDWVYKYLPENTSEEKKNIVLQVIVFSYGLIGFAFMYAVKHLGTVVSITITLAGIVRGPLLGLFSLGMLVPFANTKGATYGLFGGWIIILWIFIGAQYYSLQGFMQYPIKPVSIEGCENYANSTHELFLQQDYVVPNSQEKYKPFYLYRLSYYLYSTISTFSTFFIGIIVSWITNKNGKRADRKLLSPIIVWWMNKNSEEHLKEENIPLN